MATKKGRKKKKRPGLKIAWILAILLMFLSISIRWLNIGRYFRSRGVPFQIEVLNGTGEDDLARKTTRRLRRMGIDVLIEGNAESFDFDQSLLVDRKGNPELMATLARRLGCERVLQQIKDNPKVDVTFIIGNDVHELKIGKMNCK